MNRTQDLSGPELPATWITAIHAENDGAFLLSVHVDKDALASS